MRTRDTTAELDFRWTRWLLDEHSEAELRDWARRLRLFRFIRAHGGHANDADSLVVAYRYSGEVELMALFRALSVPLTRYSTKPPQPHPGVRYSLAAFRKFPRLVPGSRWVEQPGRTALDGEPVTIDCTADSVYVRVRSELGVDEEAVKRAERIEKNLTHTHESILDPPQDDRHCICPKYYPSFF